MNDYTAKNIKVLSDETILNSPQLSMFTALYLHVQYNKPLDWIQRSLEACERANVPQSYFIERYLDPSHNPRHPRPPMNDTVNYHSLIIQKENRK